MIRATVLLFSHRPHGTTKSIIKRKSTAAAVAVAAAVKATKEEGILVRKNGTCLFLKGGGFVLRGDKSFKKNFIY
jgi:hypothetical protein